MVNKVEINDKFNKSIIGNESFIESRIVVFGFESYDLLQAFTQAATRIQDQGHDKNSFGDYAALARMLVILDHMYALAQVDFRDAMCENKIIREQYEAAVLQKENSHSEDAVLKNATLADSRNVDSILSNISKKQREIDMRITHIKNTLININYSMRAHINTLAKYKHLLSEEDLNSLNSLIETKIGYKDALKALQNDRVYERFNNVINVLQYKKNDYSEYGVIFLDKDKQESPRPSISEKTDEDLSEPADDKKKQNLQVNEQNKSKWFQGFICRVSTLYNTNDEFMVSIGSHEGYWRPFFYYKIEMFNIEIALNSALNMLDNNSSLFYEHLGPLCHMHALLNCDFKRCKEVFKNLMNMTKESKKRYGEATKALENKELSSEDEERLSKLENEVSKATTNENAWFSILDNNIWLSRFIVYCITNHARDGELTDEACSGYINDLNGSYQNAYDKLQNYPFYKQFFGLNEVKPNGDGGQRLEEKPFVEKKADNYREDDTSKQNEIPARPYGASTQLTPPALKETVASENKKPTPAEIEVLTKQRAKMLASLTEAKNYINKIKGEVLKISMKLESDKKIIDEKHNAAPEDEVLKKVRADSEYISKNLEIFIQELAEFLRDIENRIAEL
ncbi:hypothetical protein ENBRE01_2147, partial [Enteropsectra breve]